MATSQYSILREYQPYVSPYNLDLIKEVMVYKQGKVDVNREKINNQIDLLMGQTIAKPEAREYFENKMAGVLNRVNNMYRGADLSSDGVVRHIQGEISSVLDDTVINALAGTKAGQQMMDYIHQVQLNHPEQYSSANAFVALQPYYEWLEDGQAGSRLAPLQYTPYTDYNKELRENMTTILKNHKGTTYQLPLYDDDGNPTGAMQTITKDALTPQQAADIAMSGLSQNARLQMQIEARYMAASNPQAFSLNAAMSYGQSLVTQQQQYINYLNAELAGAGSGSEQRTVLENELKKAKSDLITMQQQVRNLNENTYSPVDGALMVVEGNFKQGAASMYAYDNSSMKLEKDPIYWARLQEERMNRAQEIQWEIAKMNALLREETLRWRMYNDEANRDFNAQQKEADRKSREDIARMRYENAGGGRRGAQVGQASMDSSLTAGTVSPGSVNTEDINVNKVVDEDFKNTYQSLTTNALGLMSRLTKEDQEAYNSWVQAQMQDPTSEISTLLDSERLLKYIDEHGGIGSTIFTNISDSDTRKSAVSMYEALYEANNAMTPIKERLKREDDFLKESYIKKLSGVRLREGSTLYSREKNDAGEVLISGFLSFLRSGSDYEGKFKDAVYASGRYNTPFNSNPATILLKNVKYTSEEVYDIQKKMFNLADVVASATGENPDELKRTINDYMFRQNEDGTYSLSESMSGLGDNSMLTRLYDDFIEKGVNWNTFADELLRRTDDEKKGILEIRKDYINQIAYPTITFDLGVPTTDPSYYEAQEVERLYAAYGGKGLDKTYAVNVQRSNIKGEDGGVLYKIEPKAKVGAEKLKPILVPASAFGQINVGAMGDQNMPIANYDSGLKRMNFSDDTNDVYARYLQTNGIDTKYASVNSLLNSYTADGGILNQPKVSAEIMATVTSAADKIVRNYDKFRIQVKGYDEGGVGYTVNLMGFNKNEKPKKIDYRDSPTTFYADSIARELFFAPQVQFDNFLQAALEEEIAYMISHGTNTIRPDGSLGKMFIQAGGTLNGGGNS